jgi:hypothetical protein
MSNLPISHLSTVELRCKLQEKLHRETAPLGVGFLKKYPELQ